MHRIDRAARGIGRDRSEQRGIEDTEPDFLALHVPAGDAEVLVDRITIGLSPPTQQHAADEKDDHRGPYRPAVLLVLHYSTEVVSEPAPDGEDRQHLDEI